MCNYKLNIVGVFGINIVLLFRMPKEWDDDDDALVYFW